MLKKSVITALLALGTSLTHAAPIPYPNIGIEAPVASFIAAATGNINAYFVGGRSSGSLGQLKGGATGLPPISTNPGNNGGSGNHDYDADFEGDDLIPDGTYIGPEDLPDLGDTDSEFVDTDVSSVPEPENMALLGLALVVLGISRRNRLA